MPEPLKNIYHQAFFEKFTAAIQAVLPSFKKQQFLHQIFDEGWERKELKQRMRHIAAVLKHYLPGDFKENIDYILAIIEQLRKNGVKDNNFEYMFLPDFVEQFGLDDLKTSLIAIEAITQFTSCEFAIRPFLLKYQHEVMQQMLQWSKHSSHLVRRFSSEGCRPRLPWGMAIPALKKDPSPILPILENLKEDSSLFVRKSVANNLNDIAKDNPEVVIGLVQKWKGVSKETDWIVKHGSRTLLKKADKNIYEVFGLNGTTSCSIDKLKLSKARIKIGDRLGFSFRLSHTKKQAARLRIEYAVYYVKARGQQSKKLFKLTENNYEAGTYAFNRQQRFEDFTTRKHYPGKHKLAIVVNGKELASKEFVLMN